MPRPTPVRVDPIEMIPEDKRSREFRKKKSNKLLTKKSRHSSSKSHSKSKSRSRATRRKPSRSRSRPSLLKKRQNQIGCSQGRKKSRSKSQDRKKSWSKSRGRKKSRSNSRDRKKSQGLKKSRSKSRGCKKNRSRSKSKSRSSKKSRSRSKSLIRPLNWTSDLKNKDDVGPISHVRMSKDSKIVSRITSEDMLRTRLSPYFGKTGMSDSVDRKPNYRANKFKKAAVMSQAEVEKNGQDTLVNALIQENLQTLSGANI